MNCPACDHMMTKAVDQYGVKEWWCPRCAYRKCYDDERGQLHWCVRCGRQERVMDPVWHKLPDGWCGVITGPWHGEYCPECTEWLKAWHKGYAEVHKP